MAAAEPQLLGHFRQAVGNRRWPSLNPLQRVVEISRCSRQIANDSTNDVRLSDPITRVSGWVQLLVQSNTEFHLDWSSAVLTGCLAHVLRTAGNAAGPVCNYPLLPRSRFGLP
jgi:hypothetical protein